MAALGHVAATAVCRQPRPRVDARTVRRAMSLIEGRLLRVGAAAEMEQHHEQKQPTDRRHQLNPVACPAGSADSVVCCVRVLVASRSSLLVKLARSLAIAGSITPLA